MSIIEVYKSRPMQNVPKLFLLPTGGFCKNKSLLIVFIFIFLSLLNHTLHIFLCTSVHNCVAAMLGHLIPGKDGVQRLHLHCNAKKKGKADKKQKKCKETFVLSSAEKNVWH